MIWPPNMDQMKEMNQIAPSTLTMTSFHRWLNLALLQLLFLLLAWPPCLCLTLAPLLALPPPIPFVMLGTLQSPMLSPLLLASLDLSSLPMLPHAQVTLYLLNSPSLLLIGLALLSYLTTGVSKVNYTTSLSLHNHSPLDPSPPSC